MTMEVHCDTAWRRHLLEAMQDLRVKGHLCDTTLIAEDGRMVKAHSIMLAATSPYFHRAFCHQQMGLFKTKVHFSFRTTVQIVQFIYSGRLVLEAEDVPSLLKASQALGLKSLTNELEKGFPRKHEKEVIEIDEDDEEEKVEEVQASESTKTCSVGIQTGVSNRCYISQALQASPEMADISTETPKLPPPPLKQCVSVQTDTNSNSSSNVEHRSSPQSHNDADEQPTDTDATSMDTNTTDSRSTDSNRPEVAETSSYSYTIQNIEENQIEMAYSLALVPPRQLPTSRNFLRTFQSPHVEVLDISLQDVLDALDPMPVTNAPTQEFRSGPRRKAHRKRGRRHVAVENMFAIPPEAGSADEARITEHPPQAPSPTIPSPNQRLAQIIIRKVRVNPEEMKCLEAELWEKNRHWASSALDRNLESLQESLNSSPQRRHMELKQSVGSALWISKQTVAHQNCPSSERYSLLSHYLPVDRRQDQCGDVSSTTPGTPENPLPLNETTEGCSRNNSPGDLPCKETHTCLSMTKIRTADRGNSLTQNSSSSPEGSSTELLRTIFMDNMDAKIGVLKYVQKQSAQPETQEEDSGWPQSHEGSSDHVIENEQRKAQPSSSEVTDASVSHAERLSPFPDTDNPAPRAKRTRSLSRESDQSNPGSGVKRKKMSYFKNSFRPGSVKFVGKHILHAWIEDDGSTTWYKGYVIRVTRGRDGHFGTEYEVKYDEQNDDSDDDDYTNFVDHLLEDYVDQSLQFISSNLNIQPS